MNTSTATAWRDRYLDTGTRLAESASRAAPVLTGMNACVDAVFHIDAGRLAVLVLAADDDERPVTPDDTEGRRLIRRVLTRVAEGRGGELVTRWTGGPSWIRELVGEPDRRQIGGTGPQASWALSVLGAPSVLALADRSAAQLAVVDPRTGVVEDGRIVPAGEIEPRGIATKLEHCILEFRAGTPFATGTVRRSTRIILRFGDEPLERDEQFAAYSPGLVGTARAGLLSGLNGLSSSEHSDAAWLARLGQSWTEAALPVVHHELAEFPDTQRLRDALVALSANSIGLSLSELFVLAGRDGDPRLLARELAERAGARRIIVHADDWSLAVHRDPFAEQEDVLLSGNTLAAARARTGSPSTALAPDEGAQYTEDLPAGGTLGDGWHAVSVPSPYLARPTATIGLGDTFVAGVLLAESLP